MRTYKDMRLSASSNHALEGGDLLEPHLFSLKAVLTHNPGIGELLKSSNIERNEVAAGTGAFLPGLLSKQLHMCPVLLFQSPSLTEEEALILADIHPIVFSEPVSRGSYSPTYIGWPIKSYNLCIENYNAMHVLENGCIHGFIIIAAICGNTLSIGAFSPRDGMMDIIYEKNNASRMLRELVPPAEPPPIYGMPDDVDFGEIGSENHCTGPDGRRANIMKMTFVHENALRVPTREVAAWTIREDADEPCTEFSEVWRWVENPNERNRPVLTLASGSDVGSIVPASCHSFPLLAVYLPTDMHAMASLLAHGILTSENIISEDLMKCSSRLILRAGQQLLALKFHSYGNLETQVAQEQELIIAVRCGVNVWLRYYSDCRGWLEQFCLTKVAADNYKPHSMFTAEEISAAEARVVARLDAEYEDWLYNYPELGDDTWMPPDVPCIDTTPPIDHDMNREKVWFPVLYELQPYVMGDRDISF